MAKKRALGGVLDSIFDDNAYDVNAEGASITVLKIGEIEPNKDQPRKEFDTEKLNMLADSITEHGIIQPLTVRPYGDTYQIVAGERRWRASKIAGLTEVPVRIMELSDIETTQIALIENLQREDLNPIEEAAGYQELIEKFDMKQEDVAKKVGKARSSVTNALRLLSLPAKIQGFVKDGDISKGHCKVLMSAKTDEDMIEIADKVIKDSISVRALEKLVKNYGENKLVREKSEKQKQSTFITEAEISLKNSIGKPVKIEQSKNKITLQITLTDEDEVKDIINKLSN